MQPSPSGKEQITEVDVVLGEAPTSLGEVVVTPGYFSLMHRRPAIQQTLTRAEIREMPHLADDVYRAITRLPGITGKRTSSPASPCGAAPMRKLLVQLDGMETIRNRSISRAVSAAAC